MKKLLRIFLILVFFSFFFSATTWAAKTTDSDSICPPDYQSWEGAFLYLPESQSWSKFNARYVTYADYPDSNPPTTTATLPENLDTPSQWYKPTFFSEIPLSECHVDVSFRTDLINRMIKLPVGQKITDGSVAVQYSAGTITITVTPTWKDKNGQSQSRKAIYTLNLKDYAPLSALDTCKVVGQSGDMGTYIGCCDNSSDSGCSSQNLMQVAKKL